VGQTIFEQGDHQGAVKIFKFAAEAYPESVPILMDLAKAYARANQFDLSLQVIKKARTLNLPRGARTLCAAQFGGWCWFSFVPG
jgi:Flp pilus assembly protein TadD